MCASVAPFGGALFRSSAVCDQQSLQPSRIPTSSDAKKATCMNCLAEGEKKPAGRRSRSKGAIAEEGLPAGLLRSSRWGQGEGPVPRKKALARTDTRAKPGQYQPAVEKNPNNQCKGVRHYSDLSAV